ncbi:MAG: cobyrinate a,c-diamide synthase [Oscillospiraceae bacterium]|nr:cobyrinate a,c-diamide synthase [Oscillospiraceae bacterium]
MQQKRIMLSSTGSGTGKTTMTIALLSALNYKNLKIQSFKCGCDYIDPMFHSYITGRKTYQADPYFLEKKQLQKLFSQVSAQADISILEGAMGFYDGISGTSQASAYTVSEWLKTPVLLIISPKGMGCSLGAICKGFQNFRMPNQIQGILLNQIRPNMYEYYKKIIQQETNLQVYGYLPDLPEMKLESRHLGLLTAQEITNLDKKINLLRETALQTLELENIVKLAGTAPELPIYSKKIEPNYNIKIGIAKDKAFCFYYAENLELLEQLGAELIYFSPISDKKLPENLDGLYFGGGYPELYLPELSNNKYFIKNLKKASEKNIPVFAECGGFLYLLEKFYDSNQKQYSMAGLLSGSAKLKNQLCRFGYINLTAQENTILGNSGISIKAHEFHYADSTQNGNAFLSERPSGANWYAMQNTGNILAGFPHVYFLSNPKIAENFCKACQKFHDLQERNLKC